ncbi:translocation/assembly module TamB [Sphingomonas paeninsulae]|uniref:Translocation/assembly module TamB n=1 Tax=Sphingomonas paeninsulae TaxID=2319844 RepID=A0A494TLF6_SPHPE|nr:translocation/assembly module TamB [Sphingomonas paeninsulae]
MKWIGGALLGFLLLIAAAFWLADTSIGHRFIADRIAEIAPASGLRFKVGRIDGSIYGQVHIRDLRVSDSGGVFFESGDVALDWSPFAYASNRLDIASLIAPAATLHRLPNLKPTGKKGLILPSFDIRIGKLEITRLTIGDKVSGTPRTGSVTGRADIRDGRAMIALDARAAGDRLAFRLDAEPDRNKFDIGAALNAPSGGVFGAIIGTQRPVKIRLGGDGSWTDWHGSLTGDASGARIASLDLTAGKGRYDLDGRIVPSLVAHGKLMSLSAPSVRVKGNAMLVNRRLDTHLALGSPSLALSANGIVDLANSAFDGMRIDMRLLRPAALFPNMTGQNVKLKMLLDGTFATATFDYLLTADRAAFDTTGFETVRATGRGRLSPTPVIVPLKLTARRVTGVGDVAGGILGNISVQGLLRVTSKIISGDGLILKSDKLNGKVSLLVDLATGKYDIGLAGQLGRYLIPGLGIVDVKSELKIVPGANGRGTRVIGRGQAWVRRFDNNFLAGLAGGLPYIDTGLERDVDGLVHFINLKLTAPALRLTGNGYRRKDGSFHFEGSGVQRQYGPLKMILDGRIDRPTLDLQLARPMDSLGLRDVRAHLDPTAEGFQWQAAGGSLIGPFAGNGAILLPSGGQAVIQFGQIVASGLVAKGQLRPVSGSLDGQLALSGSGISGRLAFAPQGGVQRIEAHLTARDATLNGPPLIAARRGQVDAVLLLDPKGTDVDATIQGQGLRYGGIGLARLAANVHLLDGVGEVKASLAGSRGRAFDIQTVTQVAPNRLAVALQGTIDGKPIKLDAPGIVMRDGSGWALAPTALSFAGGSAKVGGRFGDSGIAVDADVVRMPLTVLDILYPRLALGGIASGHVNFAQTATGAAPTGRADLRIRGLTRSGLVLSSRPIDVGVIAALDARGAVMRAVAASGGTTIGQAQARIAPLPTSGTLIERLTNAPLFAQLRYNGPADTLWRLTGIESFDISGPIAVGADIGGRLGDPQIRGSIKTENLRLESPLSGTVLTGMKASGVFGGSKLVIQSFSATAGKGTLTGRATFDLSAANGFGIDIVGNAQQADIIRRDDISATVTGPLSIKSDGGSGSIAGTLELNHSSFRLGQASAAATIPRLNVRELNRPASDLAVQSPPISWSLAVKAKAANRLSVTGLGLDSEWRANLDIGGTLDEPRILGRADLLRGGYEFAGKRFDLDKGTIRFTGTTPIDPVIDIEATSNAQSLNATVRVTGTGQKPDITFTSIPALPQDELLSRLLFGTSITNLSAPEALQLAAAVASLRNSGGGLNPINALRQAIGLDRLRILPADATTGSKTALAAGKYITRRTYVEVISDGQGYSASRVEFQITRWLSLLSSISTIGRTSAAVRVSKDY